MSGALPSVPPCPQPSLHRVGMLSVGETIRLFNERIDRTSSEITHSDNHGRPPKGNFRTSLPQSVAPVESHYGRFRARVLSIRIHPGSSVRWAVWTSSSPPNEIRQCSWRAREGGACQESDRQITFHALEEEGSREERSDPSKRASKPVRSSLAIQQVRIVTHADTKRTSRHATSSRATGTGHHDELPHGVRSRLQCPPTSDNLL